MICDKCFRPMYFNGYDIDPSAGLQTLQFRCFSLNNRHDAYFTEPIPGWDRIQKRTKIYSPLKWPADDSRKAKEDPYHAGPNTTDNLSRNIQSNRFFYSDNLQDETNNDVGLYGGGDKGNKMKIKLVFEDWRDGPTGKSLYSTPAGIQLSMGDFHSGSTFTGEIDLDLEQEKDIGESMELGAVPVFKIYKRGLKCPK